MAKPGAQPPDSLVDRFNESYVTWREACAEVSEAYESWRTCSLPQREFMFHAYRAALDREENAARVHRDLTRDLRRALIAV